MFCFQSEAKPLLTQVNCCWRSCCYGLRQGVFDNVTMYRLYRLDGAGKIIAADWVEAERDDDAVTQARALASDSRCELWECGRLVAQIRGDGAA